MTTAKILETLYAVEIDNPVLNVDPTFQKLKDALKKDIAEAGLSRAEKNQHSNILKFAKLSAKDSHRISFKGAINKDGKQYIMDPRGYMAVEILTPFSDLPAVPENVAAKSDYLFLETLFKPGSYDHYEEVELPPTTDLKIRSSAYNELRKKAPSVAKHEHVEFRTSGRTHYFDPSLLLSCVLMTGATKIRLNPSNALCSAYLSGENCNAVIMPVRHVES